MYVIYTLHNDYPISISTSRVLCTMNISLAKRLDFISCRITVKSVRANLLGGGIEVTSSQLAVINSVRHFSVVVANGNANETFSSFHERIAIRAIFHRKYGMSCSDELEN